MMRPAAAQDGKPGVVGLGDLVVSGASGTVAPQGALPAGANPIDETFIDPDGASIKVFDVRNPGGPPEAQLLDAPPKFQAFARDIGQVFGLALDDNDPPNIYAAGTSAHGLHIVVPDADGDGRPERIKVGQPGAQWMDGQFGTANGGGPGTIYKVNGETGAVSKFADIAGGGAPNGGAGLGNIAYDPHSKQLFVSDLDTGLIHRLDMDGNDLGAFDHGLLARAANGMDAVPDDGALADITNPSFDAEDSGTWGLTQPERRVWGLAVYKDRLYYAVEAGPQVWSVGINEDGGFGDDPRWELDVPADAEGLPVSDIAFQASGAMLLAQRGGISSRYDYSRYHTPRKSRVLRYKLESPDDPNTPSRWAAEPEEYAIGFPGNYRNASGGLAIGYGYKENADGSTGFGSCEGTLWSSGDALRDNPVHGAKLAEGGPANVHGLQGNALGLVRPENEPPWASYYVDYDGQFDDTQASGHVGDVEIPRDCSRKQAMDLRLLKHAQPERCTPDHECPFEIEIENTGGQTYTGPLVIEDVAHSGGVLVGHAPPDWACEEVFAGTGVYRCTLPEATLAPGEKLSIELTIRLPAWWDRPVYDNCAELLAPGGGVDERPYNNRACDYVPVGGPDVTLGPPDLRLEKFGYFWSCDLFGVCTFAVRIINVGATSYTGPLSIHDTVAQPGTALLDWGPQPDWTVAAGPVAGSYDFSHPAPVTLAPGEFSELILYVQGPPPWAGHHFVRNCAYIEWEGRPHDPNPFNEYDCAEIPLFPPGHPLATARLDIDKKASPICSPPPAAPGGGWLCAYEATVTNTGGLPYGEEIELTDVTDAIGAGPGTLVSFADSPPWTCAPGGGAGVQTCKRPPGMLPGESVTIRFGFEVPAAVPTPNGLKNCAKIKHDNDGDGVAEELEDCDIALICTPGGAGDCPQDLVVVKTVQAEPCWPGFDCKFQVAFGNLGSAAHPAGLVIHDVPNPDAGPLNLPGVPPALFSCASVGPNYDCTVHVPIGPGALGIVPFHFPVPDDYPWTTLKNCAKVDPGPFNVLPFNDESCATAFIPGPDLAPFGGTECQKAVDCPLDVSVDNKGKRPFKGAMGLKGTLSPAVPIKSITSETSGMSCSVTGNGAYRCNAANLVLDPGAAAKLKLTILVPEGFQGTQIKHTKEMVWPDSKVKDRNPKNDKHISTITIEQPPEPTTPPPPPPPPAGKPDLAISKSAMQQSCNANRNCNFRITVSSAGNAAYSGPVTITDTVNPGNVRFTGANPKNWNCSGTGNGVTCTNPNVNLAPGASTSLILSFAAPRYQSGTVNNCALLSTGGGGPPRSGNTVRDVQSALAARGFDPGPADGKAGSKTIAAVRAFQRQVGLPANGRIDAALLNALFGQPGGGADDNPANNRACATAALVGEKRPEPPQCTGGQVRTSSGNCACPSHKPVWTGQQCIPRPPQPCSGGRYRNNAGQCVCPSHKPVWTGQVCVQPPPQQCTGGRVRNSQGQCVCPQNKPVWNGQYCAPKQQQCTGGRVPGYNGQCTCPPGAPVWTGVICIPKIQVCTGGRQLVNGQCKCPVSLPIWNGKSCGGIQGPKCTGGQIYIGHLKKCVCPSNKPNWNGKSCYGGGHGGTPTPGGGEIKPLPSPQCSGGRIRNSKGQCVCPPNKPQWTGSQCIPKIQITPGLQINPNILKKIPGLQ